MGVCGGRLGAGVGGIGKARSVGRVLLGVDRK